MGFSWKNIMDFTWLRRLTRKKHKDEQKTTLLVEWQPELSVNVRDIDYQHKVLINMINDLDFAIAAKKDREVLANLISKLTEYAAFHFAHEEGYLRDFGYPETKQHEKAHTYFDKKLSEFEESFGKDETVSKEMLVFLTGWLVEHIQVTDKKYATFLNEHGIR